jgi:hypothetical protein
MWTTATDDLRTLLSDGPTDRYYFRKRCFGEVTGLNVRYKTFEFRRVTDFTTSPGVYINGGLLPASGVSADSLLTGEFILVTPPIDGDVVEASYYTQWFLDSELNTFLVDSSRWLLTSDDYSQMNPGLIPAALKYAASEAYLKMAQRWRDYMSSTYKVEDSPKDEASARVDSFVKMSETFRDQALKLRDEFYKRQGQPLQPLFGMALGNVRSLP